MVDNIVSQKDIYTTYLNDLKDIKNINSNLDSDYDARFRGGGIDGRKKLLIESNPKDFNSKDYQKVTGASSVTTHRDFNEFKKEKFLINGKKEVLII